MSEEIGFDHGDLDDRDPLPVRKETGPMLFLSLFLLLLAFFILLNSISTLQETKSRDVLSSVASTFQTETDPSQKSEVLVSTLGPVLQPERVIEEVERLWLSEIPFVKIDRVTAGRQIVVELPIIQLFVGGEARLRGDREDLIRAVSHVLSARLPDQSVVMQVSLFVDHLADVPLIPDPEVEAAAPLIIDTDNPEAILTTPTARRLEATDLAFARVGVLAEGLVSGGAPPASLEVGVKRGNTSRIRFRFFIRDTNAAHVTFKDKSSEDKAAAGGQGG